MYPGFYYEDNCIVLLFQAGLIELWYVVFSGVNRDSPGGCEALRGKKRGNRFSPCQNLRGCWYPLSTPCCMLMVVMISTSQR